MKNQINLLVIQIPQDLNKEINNIRNKSFTKTGNPSFKMLEPCLLLGIYKNNKLPKHIDKISQPILINKNAQCEDELLYFPVYNENGIINLKQNFILNELDLPLDKKICNKFLPLEKLLMENKYPIIFLASNVKNKETNSYNLKKNYKINDIRLNLLNVKFTELGIIYSLLDYRHLSNCK
ncbi:MAG: hypothetical protein JJE21_06860 [Spirochaetaceae bacterium]|nr:hypothetical protein [Spirochaetaceae bacterium]